MTEVLSEITQPPRNQKAVDQAKDRIADLIQKLEGDGFPSHDIGSALVVAFYDHVLNQFAKDDSHKVWAVNALRRAEKDCQWMHNEIVKGQPAGYGLFD